MNPVTTSDAARFLQQHDHYLIITHKNPDGDTVGSAAALCLGLRKLGKDAKIFANPQFTPLYAPFLEGLTSCELDENTTVISTDVAAERMFPYNMPQRPIALAIDHHGSNTFYAPMTCVHPDDAACGMLILEVLEYLGVAIDTPIANALYLAISTDTGCFQFQNTSAEAFTAAAKCAAFGADLVGINKRFFMTKSLARLRLESYLTQNAQFSHDGAVCLCAITRQIKEELGVTEDDLSEISGYPRTIEGVKISIMVRDEADGSGKASVRTELGIDASAICSKLGGGGHKGAAGASVPGGVEAIKTAILGALEEYLQENPCL